MRDYSVDTGTAGMDEISREQCELAEKLNAKNAPDQLLRQLSEEGAEWGKGEGGGPRSETG